jgi:hypothetical protein
LFLNAEAQRTQRRKGPQRRKKKNGIGGLKARGLVEHFESAEFNSDGCGDCGGDVAGIL